MEFDEAKENIQPLAKGRNASMLYNSLKDDAGKQLIIQRQHLEKEIHNYSGDDPLSVWYNYIYWIEQSYPAAGKESGLSEVLNKCLTRFQNDERYYQDQRMVKLFIKLIEKNKNPAECYYQLFEAGIGTMVADFYIAWAYCFDLLGNFRKADEIFRRGIACRAQPLEVLKEAHQHFGFIVAQRIMYKDDNTLETECAGQLDERRRALTLLRSHKNRHVGSTRTGAAVKENMPGIFQTSLVSASKNNDKMKVFADENVPPMIEKFGTVEGAEVEKSVIQTIIDSNKENQVEPGPWNKAYKPSNSENLFNNKNPKNALDFKILEDTFDDTNCKQFQKTSTYSADIRFDKPFIYPPNHVAKNLPQKEWVLPITSELIPYEKAIAQYNKCMVYPRPNVEFQLEEYGCYIWLRKRNIENNFTKKREKFWSNGPNYNVRQYPHFAKQSNTQCLDSLDQFFVPVKVSGLIIAFDAIYNVADKEERQFEEIMALKLKCNETIIKAIDMEETVCYASGAKFIRKSFLPMRQSIAPVKPNKQKIVATLPMLAEFEFKSKNLQTANENPKHQQEQEQEQKSLTDAASFNSDVVNFSSKNSDQLQMPSFRIRSNEMTAALPARDVNLEGCSPNLPMQDECENNFQFKTPLLPSKNEINSAKNNLPFEIFEDSIASKSIHPITDKTDSNHQNKAVNFDCDETCSTHIFNKFLKVQSVSTPKPSNKSSMQSTSVALPQNRDTSPKNENSQHHQQAVSVSVADSKGNTNANLPLIADANDNASPSSPRKLSTILETSEHGTTHSTHTTGTTTKSTISSPENDLEAKHAPQISSQQAIKEQYDNKSAVNIDVCKEIDLSGNKSALSTPSVARFNCKSLRPFNFSIFEEPLMDVIPKNAGNFSRLEEREDTSTEKLVKQPYIQEDKTESLSKLFLASPTDVGKFVEDKTDTIPGFLIKSARQNQLEGDHSVTIPKLPLFTPIAPNKMENLVVGGSEKLPTKKLTPDTSELEKCKDTDDLLEFFAKSPPKTAMTSSTKTSERMDHQRNQFCKISSQLTYNPVKRDLFNDDLNSNSRSPSQQSQQQHSVQSKNILRNDSFLPEFSLNEPVQQTINSEKVNEISKINYSMETKLFEAECFSKRNCAGGNCGENNYVAKPFAKTRKIQADIASDESVCILETQPAVDNTSYSGHPIQQIKVCDSVRKISSIQMQTSQSANVSSDASALNHILMDTFVKDFANIACNRPTAASVQLSSSNGAATFRKLKNSSDNNRSSIVQSIIKGNNDNSILESHTQTNTFNSNLSKIKNSTSLPNNERQMQHANTSNSNSNQNILSYSSEMNNHNTNQVRTKLGFLSIIPKDDEVKTSATAARTVAADLANTTDCFGHDVFPSKLSTIQEKNLKTIASGCKMNSDPTVGEDECNIYYKHNEHKGNAQYQSWDDDDDDEEDHQHKMSKDNKYVHADCDLNQTQQLIDNFRVDPNINPFNVDLINAFLYNINFTNYIENLPNCELVGHVTRLHPKLEISVHDEKFEIFKMIDSGAYGNIYSGKSLASNKKYAFKRERPANFWEYYICLEIQDRINIDEMLPAFMSVDYAIIGNNASILITSLSEYGSLITVCNKIKAKTLKNIDESIVMLLTCELLQIIDHLHAVNIIHADIKADNFLLTNRLSYPNVDSQRYIQLIDFGVSIDMKLFNQNQTFTYVHKDKSIQCVEMRQGRPWTYQLDLYGLASVIHVLLFGKYMDVEQKSSNGIWMPRTHMPRYWNRTLWETIFKNLLNIPDCQVMPNLQQLRALLQEEMEEKRSHLIRMIIEFNKALLA